MGVIKKILYRGNVLGKPRHHNFFLDMEENIHIHYRDLRIELSRGEFEDIVQAFRKQSAELQAIIEQKNYQDGKLPNANQEDVRIWTEARLKNEVRYHPQRFSLEECGDGYHFHYRNYKFLIDQDEFRQIAQVFRSIDIDGAYAQTYEEVLGLLEANDVDFLLAAGNVPGEILAVEVPRYHLPKMRDIFAYIGFEREVEGAEHRYRGARLLVVVREDKVRSAGDFRRIRGNRDVCQLADYLARQGVAVDANELNRIKCQVLDLYFALKAGEVRPLDLDPLSWLYSAESQRVIFPYSSATAGESVKAAEVLYRAWSALLNSHKLGFVKPRKTVFAPPLQAPLKEKIHAALKQNVASVLAVERIYIMGSATRGEMGRYQAPFIHGKLAKLGSDVDVLVEIHADREEDLPRFWQLHMEKSSNSCAIYHVGEVPLAEDTGEWQAQYPKIPFLNHLLDAYVFLPSRSDCEVKDAFLKKFGAELLYDRSRDGGVVRGEDEKSVAEWFGGAYALPVASVEKMTVTTDNGLYRILCGDDLYVLKQFLVSGNYEHTRIAEHTDYEGRLSNLLHDRGVRTARVIPAKAGLSADLNGHPALLFERMRGAICNRPEYPVDKAAAALADIHEVQRGRALDLPTAFSFEHTCDIWLPAFLRYAEMPTHGTDIAEAFAALMPMFRHYENHDKRRQLFARGTAVHCHGDVKPRNLMVAPDGSVTFFDFNNAFYGPRLADVYDGAYEFALAEKYIHLADFARFDAFVAHYQENCPLSAAETEDMPHWARLIGIIKFTKEVRVLVEQESRLRRQRALAIAGFLRSRPAIA